MQSEMQMHYWKVIGYEWIWILKLSYLCGETTVIETLWGEPQTLCCISTICSVAFRLVWFSSCSERCCGSNQTWWENLGSQSQRSIWSSWITTFRFATVVFCTLGLLYSQVAATQALLSVHGTSALLRAEKKQLNSIKGYLLPLTNLF